MIRGNKVEQFYAENGGAGAAPNNGSNNKKKGGGSFFIGFAVGFFIMCLISVGLILLERDLILKKLQAIPSGETNTSDSKTLSAITDKMKLIENEIDATFLYEVDYEKMGDEVYKAMVNALGDKYSTYYTVDEYKAMQASTSGTYAGLGALVSKDDDTGYIKIVSLFENSGALEAGIKEGDMVKAIEGQSVVDMELTYATSIMKGEKNTQVNITMYRPSTGETWDLTVTRREIELKSVGSRMLDDGIGYIAVEQFEANTAGQFRKELESIKEQGAKAVIIDIRSNPGGLVNTVVNMCDALLPKGLVVYTEDKNGRRSEYTSSSNCDDIPIAVLVDGDSASASEIFAGAMQDYERGPVIGTQTYGKGIVQTIVPLKDGTALKLTVSTYYTPKGRCIHGTGIEPDIIVEYDEEKASTGEWRDDTQVMAAYEYLLEKIK
ncbi:MAG: S41 family peptidase [Lachnospiraceae bacterium]|nr:S41 family peptidase [Lachnospiraceae bacterium]